MSSPHFTILITIISSRALITLLLVLTVVMICAAIYLYIKLIRLNRRVSTDHLKRVFLENDMFRQLLDNIPDRIYFKDRESRFILANKFVSAAMGATDPTQLIDKTDFDFYDKKYAQGYYDDEQKIMKEGRPIIEKEEKGLNLKGEEITVSTTKIPVMDRHNLRVVGIIGIGRDISAQKMTEEELKIQSKHLNETNALLEERQEAIQQMAEELNVQTENLITLNKELEHLSLVASKTENVVVIMDANANFTWVNSGFENKYLMNLEEFISKNGSNLRDSSSNENIAAILNQIYISRGPFTYTSKNVDGHGNEKWYQTNISPILDQQNEITNLILIDSDITGLKEAELQIKQQNAVIEERTVELQKLNATKDRLFSIIAHDLKNPFHSIMGLTEILSKQYQNIEREKLGEFLGMISLSTNSAYQLLENLLEWARSQTGNIRTHPESILLSDLMQGIIGLQQLPARNKDISIVQKIAEQTTVWADQYMLNTVIRNIISNAIKYSQPGGTIAITSRMGSGQTCIEIEDNGVGIPEEKRGDLFQLDKVKSTAGTGGEKGTGLGLIICHDFMEKNNGSIEVISKPKKGTKFILVLPSSQP